MGTIRVPIDPEICKQCGRDMIYNMDHETFQIRWKCPHCGHEIIKEYHAGGGSYGRRTDT